MNNEEKILSVLEQLQGDMTTVKEKLDILEEHAEITRGATNSLIEWADNVSVITQVKFPVKNG